MYFDATSSKAMLYSPNGAIVQQGASQVRLVPHDGLLQSVSNGVGGPTTLSYATVRSLGGVGLPLPAWVVTQTVTTNGLTGIQATNITRTYTYGTPIYDSADRVFTGFKTVTETLVVDGNAPSTQTTTTFAEDACVETASCAPNNRGFYRALRGLPALVEVSAGSTKNETVFHEYALVANYTGLDGQPVTQLSPYQDHTYLWNDTTQAGSTASLQIVHAYGFSPTLTTTIPNVEIRKQRNVDPFGNEHSVVDFGLVGKDTPIMQTRVWGLANGDTTGWSYRPMKVQTAYATADGRNFSMAATERDFSYTASGQLEEVSAVLTGASDLPGPSSGSRSPVGGLGVSEQQQRREPQEVQLRSIRKCGRRTGRMGIRNLPALRQRDS